MFIDGLPFDELHNKVGMTFVRLVAIEQAGNIFMLKTGQNLELCHSQLFFSGSRCGGSNNSGGFLLFQGEEFLVAVHEELGLAGFSQREQITVLGVRCARKNGRPATSRSSAMSASQATSVNFLRSQASRSLAGAPKGDRSARRAGCWCRG